MPYYCPIAYVPTPVRFRSPDRIFTRPPVVRGAVTGSDYMLASYETESNTGRALSANAPSETTPGTSASPSAPTNVYLYAGDQIIENVTMGYFYYQDSLGNTSHVSDAAGTLLERYTYSANTSPFKYEK